MIAQRVQIEGRNVALHPSVIQVIDAKLQHIKKQHRNPIKSIRIVLVGSRHHRTGAFEVHVVACVPGNTIVVNEKGQEVHPLVEQAFDTLNRRFLKERQRSSDRRQKAGDGGEPLPDETGGLPEAAHMGDVVI